MNDNQFDVKKESKAPIIALLVIAIIGVVGGTFAYFTSTTEFENRFQTKPYSTQVSEEFTSPESWLPGTETPKTIKAKNTGEIDVAVRISYSEEWKNHNGYVLDGNISYMLNETTVQERAAIINFDNTSDWIKEGNYYYYKNKLTKNDETSSFIKSVTFNPNVTADINCISSNNGLTQSCLSTGNGYDNALYKLTLTVETIQYDGYKAGWGTNVTIN